MFENLAFGVLNLPSGDVVMHCGVVSLTSDIVDYTKPNCVHLG